MMCFEHRYALPIAPFHLSRKYFKHDSAMHREHLPHIRIHACIIVVRNMSNKIIFNNSCTVLSFLFFVTARHNFLSYMRWKMLRGEITHISNVFHREFLAPFEPCGAFQRPCIIVISWPHSYPSRTWYSRSASMPRA